MARSMGALDGIGCAHAAAVLVGEAEHGEPLGHGVFQPGCELGCGGLVGLHEPVQLFLGAHQGGGIPDAAEFSADGFADGRIRRVVDGVLSQMKLAALPPGARKDGLAGGAQPGVIIAGDEVDPAQAASDQIVKKAAPVDLGFRQGGGDAKHAPAAFGIDADRRQNGGITHHSALADLLVTGVEQQVLNVAQRPAAPRL